MFEEKKIPNDVVIANVNYGKTTLLDQLLKHSHIFKANGSDSRASRG